MGAMNGDRRARCFHYVAELSKGTENFWKGRMRKPKETKKPLDLGVLGKRFLTGWGKGTVAKVGVPFRTKLGSV